jgi:hypothetical protein
MMANILPQKTPTFECETCRFITANKKDYNRHIATAKHKRLIESSKMKQGLPMLEFSCHCGKSYLHQSSLCKHKNKCKGLIPEKSEAKVILETELIYKLLNDLTISQNQNAEYQKQMIELMKEKNTSVSNITTNNTTNNMQININMFLNEYCKDAITIEEFIKSIRPSIEDVLYMTKRGNREGLSKILTTALGQLEITERPLHCTDLKRNTTYIKEPDGWIKDKDDAHMKKLCATTQHECIKTAASILSKNTKYAEKGTKEYEDSIQLMAEITKEPEYEPITKLVNESIHLDKTAMKNAIENK